MSKKETKKGPLTSPRGMHDILENNYYKYQGLFEKAQEVAVYYGFKPIEIPVLEHEEVFTSSVGVGTDIVDKEMYTLRTRGGDRLSMRPEGTAGVMRAYLQHGMQSFPQPVMLYYYGPFFRHDNPQKGRLRELRQFGLEVLGTEKSIADAMIIRMTHTILSEAGIKNPVLEINSIGDKECRPTYVRELVNYYKKHSNKICEDCRERIKINPLRVLDCKKPECLPIKEGAPDPVGHLCQPCKHHFKEVLEYLEEVGIPYNLNKNLVRGLNYYTRTVFEFSSEAVEGIEQLSLAAGGRYDYLARALDGKRDVPSVGVSLGIDRIVLSPLYANLAPRIMKKPKIFFIQLGSEAKMKSLNVIEIMRKSKIPVHHSLSKDSLGSQLSAAEKLNIPYVMILGQKEAIESSVIVRDMKEHSQETIKNEKLMQYLKDLK
ncbi:histidine--tRNA ligase [Candidatus Nomurabacteria bacterium RIFCSPLOWO2_02_FULL_42_17]|uniref:Histidine--tRNA ligase n=2 Tax=Candidatus Nomuraibacteriota TaxID=1752729 RepID=A0A1F6WLG6_9BACT|nr:MAG: histidine--tRNA ligase [Candidatus Nomurabacteria bacterium RIFCSPHIGHO2_02_FULL_42_24]OGI96772.1 MAG: histidine--tRNA ligase [Candidatus Nomurabacteria bacterium RIFCSPLOWO2_02_FULL_42_17]